MTTPAKVISQNTDKTENLILWKPGQSGNPGGRPKGLAAKVRELVPPEQLTEFYLAILTRDAKVLRKLGIKVTEVLLSDRTKAADWLADRGYGKAPIHEPVTGGDPLELDGIDRSIDSVLDDLASRRETNAARESAAGVLEGDGEERAASA